MKPTIVPVALRGTPQEVYARLGPHDGTALLESSMALPGSSGWSCIAGPAVATLITAGDDGLTQLVDAHDGHVLQAWPEPFAALRELLARLASAPRADGPPFAAGLVGHLGYDLVRHIERLPAIADHDPPLPPLRLLLCDHMLAYEHARDQWHACTARLPWGDPAARQAQWRDTLARVQHERPVPAGRFRAGPLQSRTGPERYRAQVRQVLDFIAAGDIFQANLSHRFEGAFEGDAYALYCALTARNPAPFGAFIPAVDHAIASVSPERFLRLQRDMVTARPIKGTRARRTDPALDAQRRQELQASVKDRAENLMIVDLMRNDLGRVAQVGSVAVPGLFEIEAHPSVWQMVSTVQARLRPGLGAADLLRACWPPGSMTGAPKVRAMEIIESLEPVRRGPYAGAIGYFDVGGAMDLSVVIRTAIVHRQRVMLQLGGAVVADSDPQQELDETLAKGHWLLQVLQGAAA